MIEGIELSNWKVFADLRLPFSKGINFVAGPNGIGKSSILQAIHVAFTGGVPDRLDIRRFIRQGADSADIKVKFRIENELLYIERRISTRRKERCSISNSEGGEIFSGGWEETTKYIENLFKIQRFLFDEIFFVSEGDVYRTIHEPPGKQLLDEIDRSLGIGLLQSLAKEVSLARMEFGKEEMRHRETLENVALATETKEDPKVLEIKHLELRGARDQKRREYDESKGDLWSLEDQLRRMRELLDELLLIDSEEKIQARDEIRAKALQKELKQNVEENRAITSRRLRFEAEISYLQKIADIVKGTQQLDEIDIKCPVCHRKISKHKISEIKDETMTGIRLHKKKVSQFLESSRELGTEREKIESELNEINERKIRLRALREKHMGRLMKVDEVRKKIAEINEEIGSLKEKVKVIGLSLVESETKIGDLREKIGSLRAFSQYENLQIADVTNDLTIASKGGYLTEFTLKGIKELIRRQRDSKLREKLFRYISKIWNSFKGENGWTVTLDQLAAPVVELESEQIPFTLLSGGEKTALLIITRTILSKLFAKGMGSLLLDEPLEHLDSRNRHSLLQFLVDAYEEKIVDQLIVTTTEESLLRKFVDYDFVKIIPLERLISIRTS